MRKSLSISTGIGSLHEAADLRRRRWIRAQDLDEAFQRVEVAEGVDRDAGGVVAHAAGHPRLARNPIHPGPEADALHDAADVKAPPFQHSGAQCHGAEKRRN